MLKNKVENLVFEVNNILNSQMKVSYYDGLGIFGGNESFDFKNSNLDYKYSVAVSEFNFDQFIEALKEIGFIYEYKLVEIQKAFKNIFNGL